MNHPDMQLEVTMERTADLVPYASNAKVHTDEQIKQICTSIEEFGFADPVGVWTNADGKSEIVEGHGRVLAAQKLGIEKIPVIHLDALTDEQRRAYMLAHNQLTMGTGWDAEALNLELDALAADFDMGDFGFDARPDFDPLSMLVEEGYIHDSLDGQITEFSVTFVFPKREEGIVTSYINSVGKEKIVADIIDEAHAWE